MSAAGRFDRRIEIHRATFAPDAANTPTATWPPAGGTSWLRWAEYRPVPVRQAETQAAQQLVAKSYVEFIVRADSEIAAVTSDDQYRIVFEGRNHDITDVMPSVKRGETITFTCYARAE